jgi:hypothetical protein
MIAPSIQCASLLTPGLLDAIKGRKMDGECSCPAWFPENARLLMNHYDLGVADAKFGKV